VQWRNGGFKCGAQLTKRFDGQHDADPIAERPDHSRRNEGSRTGKVTFACPQRQNKNEDAGNQSLDSCDSDRIAHGDALGQIVLSIPQHRQAAAISIAPSESPETCAG